MIVSKFFSNYATVGNTIKYQYKHFICDARWVKNKQQWARIVRGSRAFRAFGFLVSNFSRVSRTPRGGDMRTGATTAAIVVFVAANAVVGLDPLESAHGRLVFSTLLYRHGERSVEYTYPNDLYANESYWPMGFGQLTPMGIVGQFELGKWLRKRYDGWLPRTYRTEDVYVQSSDVDRTLMSAEANLAGMYPPVGPKNWNGAPGERVQLVPIHTVPKSQDRLLKMTMTDCPEYGRELDEVENSSELSQYFAQYSSINKIVKKNTNMKMDDTRDLILCYTGLYYSLIIEWQFNYTLPEWTKSLFPEPLITMTRKISSVETYNDILKRLRAGPLLSEILSHMHEKRNGTLSPDRMLWIYSAHDSTISSLMNAMGLDYGMIVPYNAVLMIELRLNAAGTYVVTISYRNTTDHEPYLLRVPGCDSTGCELDRLTDVLRPVTPVDWNVECQIKSESHFWKSLVYIIGFTVASVVVMLLAYVMAAKIMYCIRRPTDYQAC